MGRFIAECYVLVFGASPERALEASALRGRSRDTPRDNGGQRVDWRRVLELLHRSYQQLYSAAQPCQAKRREVDKLPGATECERGR